MTKLKMMSRVPYQAPSWASCLHNAPSSRLQIGHFPTPIFPFPIPDIPCELFIKRDDFSGMETSGNKIRKLEFLLADALDAGSDCVVTCGGIQSNHCRATACAGRLCGLDAYLLLRTSRPEELPGYVGNLLVNRLMDAHMILLSSTEYAQYGSEAMIQKTCERLRKEGRKPYAIPVGGSNGIGTWGYIRAVEELHQQMEEQDLEFTDMVFACGSAGSAAGLGLGTYLYAKAHPTSNYKFKFEQGVPPPIHAYSVCDTPEYFYDFIDTTILPQMGFKNESEKKFGSRQFLNVKNAKGIGYARSSDAELEFIHNVARTTGVVLDPVYTGKALYKFVQEIKADPETYRGRKILFVHTGGLFGLYEQTPALSELLPDDRIHRFTME